MKRKFITRTILNFLVFMFAVSTGYSQVSGSGNVVKQDRKTGTFTGISVSSGIDLTVKQGTQNALIIEADDNLQDYIISEVEKGVLKIYVKPNSRINRSHAMDAHVTISNLKSISVSGGGDIESVNKITSDDLAFSVSGGGDLAFEFSASDTKCSVSGGGDVALDGESREMQTSISGGGDLVMDVAMSSLMLSMSGGGDAVIDGGDGGSETKISMSGGGDLVMDMACELVSVSVSGGGDVVVDAGDQVSNASFSVGGGGDLALELNANELAISMVGGGDANLNGSADRFSGEIKSGGDLQARGFMIQTASLELIGGSDAWIHVEKDLAVKGTGGSQIYVTGNPRIDANLTGGSKVHQE